ncbi:MAG: hypothetical protein HFE59_05185 [Clostridiales bacterium]|nr:hypothetical protein [Clostridiales bacterium]
MLESLHSKIQKSPFRNIYWFARYLMNTDQYGALGKSKETRLLATVYLLENLMTQNFTDDDEKLIVIKNTLLRELMGMVSPNSKISVLTNNLVNVLKEDIQSLEDIVVFCITVRYVVSPINHALSSIPSNDSDFCRKSASSILETLGEEKAGLVISTWDKLGATGCLNIERTTVVEEFTRLIENLKTLKIEHTLIDDNILLTAFVQEFERRLGQKRKARGGASLETAVSFLFEYYGFNAAKAPEHFNQDLEVDKWFKGKDGWMIGISCKRTLRERWKQLSQADRGTLSRFKINELWHLITYDKDLTDDKIVRLGEQGQIFYLMNESETYKKCSSHIGMKSYVRPLSQLISDIRKNIV